ncbi:MAG: low molecular weight protein-tyrosine-phosphatase [Prevotella sp.]
MAKKGKIRILFICLGNICRSPAANGIMQKMVDQRGVTQQFHIDSAGIGNWHVGDLPDARMRRHGQARGYDFTHRARQFDAITDFDRFDIIVTMDEDNYHAITRMAGSERERRKVVRMTTYLKQHPQAISVPDPYYGDGSDFELALDLIEDGCKNLLEELTDNAFTTSRCV